MCTETHDWRCFISMIFSSLYICSEWICRLSLLVTYKKDFRHTTGRVLIIFPLDAIWLYQNLNAVYYILLWIIFMKVHYISFSTVLRVRRSAMQYVHVCIYTSIMYYCRYCRTSTYVFGTMSWKAVDRNTSHTWMYRLSWMMGTIVVLCIGDHVVVP